MNSSDSPSSTASNKAIASFRPSSVTAHIGGKQPVESLLRAPDVTSNASMPAARFSQWTGTSPMSSGNIPAPPMTGVAGLRSPATLLTHDIGSSQAPVGESLMMSYHALAAMESNADLPEYVKTHKAVLSFPEKLMFMLIHVEREFSKSGQKLDNAPIAWVLDGHAFVIRHNDQMTAIWLPLFFREAKFSSFTRKLYRWGFRQVNMTSSARPNGKDLCFGNENFQRDNKKLMVNMRSVTAAGTRREQNKSSFDLAPDSLSFGESSNATLAGSAQHLAGQYEALRAMQSIFQPQQIPPFNPLASLSSLSQIPSTTWSSAPVYQRSMLPVAPILPLPSSFLPQGVTGTQVQQDLASLLSRPQDGTAFQYMLMLSRLRNSNLTSALGITDTTQWQGQNHPGPNSSKSQPH